MKIDKLLCVFFLCSFSFQGFAQDTVFYKSPRLRVVSLDKCDYFAVFSPASGASQLTETDYDRLGNKQAEKQYIIAGKDKMKTGVWKEWTSDGKLSSIQHYENDLRVGALTTYWPDGTVRRADTFQNNVFISGKCYDSSGREITHFAYETLPEYPGGEEEMYRFLSRKIYYPQVNLLAEGKVVARFVITEHGDIENVEILSKVSRNMANQVKHAISKMPKWKPGSVDGVPLSTFYTLTVTFKHEDIQR